MLVFVSTDAPSKGRITEIIQMATYIAILQSWLLLLTYCDFAFSFIFLSTGNLDVS